MKAIEINRDEWESSLSDFTYSLFITPQWVSAMENENSKAVHINFVKRNSIIAKIAGVVMRGKNLKGNQLYFYAGPALRGSNQATYDECFEALKRFAQYNNMKRVIVGSYDQQHCLLPEVKGFFHTKRYEYIVDFTSSKEIHFSTGFRKNVKRAERIGTTFHCDRSISTLEKMLTLLGVTHDLREVKYGKEYNPFYMPNLNAYALQKLLESKMGIMYYTITEGHIHSVQFNIESEGKVYGLLMGSDSFAYQNGLPSFVDYNLITTYAEKKFKYYNPGGGPVGLGGEGIEKYKKALGGIRVDMGGATTNYLSLPHNVLNPIMQMGRRLPDSNPVISFLKSLV